MGLLPPLFIILAVTSFCSAGAVAIVHDKVQPFAQPAPVTISEKVAVKFKPSLAIRETCHPYPAVNAAGETSRGLKGEGKPESKCRGSELGSQVYGRATWHKGMWAIMYAWYFPKDSVSKFGQRHKWNAAVVWLDNPAIVKPEILAVSAIGVNGVYDIRTISGPPRCYKTRSSEWCEPALVDCINGTTPMLRYIPGKIASGLMTTTNRGRGEFQDLIMWEQLTEAARSALTAADFGAPFVDGAFKSNLDSARPSF
ncbi:necrosis inducing-like protein NPP1 type [Phytophthora sojae]|uniref:Necrosis inducing-like protein NPP1 type n=1 Tax=Phytophthora sojae (strain P6497) TaxID=1094619 RepID=G4YT33_PHYSP|nr:necrosis inducing-like protein NPP1 type [Phytophthora sojae]EGZ25959.1 necrosis inducing-like protein NPP1 type [Phytophthora sojae]|eukprot:XP_009521247.1 necrosis inducing-like protein NPP1 type [Phytophthora sojae]